MEGNASSVHDPNQGKPVNRCHTSGLLVRERDLASVIDARTLGGPSEVVNGKPIQISKTDSKVWGDRRYSGRRVSVELTFEACHAGMNAVASALAARTAAGIATRSSSLHCNGRVDLDYNVFVACDCCADLNADVHSCVLDKILSRRTTVLTASELMNALH